MVKVQEHDGQFFLTVPKDIVIHIKLKKGEDMIVVLDQDEKDIIYKRRK